MKDRDHHRNARSASRAAAIVDGNAIAGLLADIFSDAVTRITLACGNCGREGPIEEAVVERDPRCAIVRCRSCTHTLLSILVGVDDSSHELRIAGGGVLTLGAGDAPPA